MGGCRGCIKATPFASAIATIFVIVGAAVFAFSTYIGLDKVIKDVLHGIFDIHVQWLSGLKVASVILSVGMAVYAVILLIFGALATGGTRNRIYKGTKCIMGGRISAAFFIIVTYFLTLAWLVVLGTLLVPLIAYVMTDSICIHEIEGRGSHTIDGSPIQPHLPYSPKGCFNLTRFGIYMYPNRTYDPYHDRVENPAHYKYKGRDYVCEALKQRQLCDYSREAGLLFCIAVGGAALVLIGLSVFNSILSASYIRIRLTKELTDYRKFIDYDVMMEKGMRSCAGSRASLGSRANASRMSLAGSRAASRATLGSRAGSRATLGSRHGSRGELLETRRSTDDLLTGRPTHHSRSRIASDAEVLDNVKPYDFGSRSSISKVKPKSVGSLSSLQGSRENLVEPKPRSRSRENILGSKASLGGSRSRRLDSEDKEELMALQRL